MIIKKIILDNFRNYGRLELEVGPSVNIIYGNNAQGKTNIIEAINVCSTTSSHRVNRDNELVMFNKSYYSAELILHDEVYGTDMDLKASFYLDKDDIPKGKKPGRELFQDGAPIRKISDYIGVCNTVIFAPEDLNLVKGAPSGRRRFFNMLISKVSPTYMDLISNANKAIKRKNDLLKTYGGRIDNINDNDLDLWDFYISDTSADLILFRYRYALLLSKKASMHHSVISGGKENLTVEYDTITDVKDLLKRLLDDNGMFDLYVEGRASEAILSDIRRKLSDLIYKKLKASRKKEVEKGISLIGVHRDDLDIRLNGVSMRSFGSQGQQRSASLSLKLAELEIIREMVSNSPILLLDDVFSELDSGRRTSLLAGMKGAQIFITCTDKTYIENEMTGLLMDGVKPTYIRVENGCVFVDN